MSKIFNPIVIAILFATIIIFIGCTDQYENHALAFRNNTQDSIQVDRYYPNTIKPRTTMIGPDEYGKFFPDFRKLTPKSHLIKTKNFCDLLLFFGKQ